jgi:hypothetical protein
MTVRRSRRRWLLAVLATVCATLAFVAYWGRFTTRFGGPVWIPVSSDTFWLPTSITLAMRDPLPEVKAETPVWTEITPGFEIAELPVLADGVQVDRVMLARIDPALFRFSIRNDPTGAKRLDDWMTETSAVLIVNGSYYARDGKPSTPVVSDGRPIGPPDYEARHGAFIAADGTARVEECEAAPASKRDTPDVDEDGAEEKNRKAFFAKTPNHPQSVKNHHNENR